LMYMSPEQLRSERLTAASDIFSMAVVAYEMVAGRRPFNPTTPAELLECQRSGVDVKPIALRRNLPPKAQEVVIRGLSFKSGARYSNAKQFGDDLSDALLSSHTPPKWEPWLKDIRAPLILIGVALIAFAIYLIFDGPPKPRSFNYFLTVQKMRDGQPYQEPFRSHGEKTTYENGDRFRLTVSTPIPAYLYIFNEAPDTGFRMIYPNQATNNGSPSLGANQSVQSDWFTFRGPAGAENFWIVWSTAPVIEMDSAATEAAKHNDGELTGQTLVTVKQYLTAKEAEINAITYNYNANQTAVVRARYDLLVALAQFKHQ
jgi:serine/threonine protein kinase